MRFSFILLLMLPGLIMAQNPPRIKTKTAVEYGPHALYQNLEPRYLWTEHYREDGQLERVERSSNFALYPEVVHLFDEEGRETTKYEVDTSGNKINWNGKVYNAQGQLIEEWYKSTLDVPADTVRYLYRDGLLWKKLQVRRNT